ncbi:DUF2243 domain-containing protein [Ensifer sp. IC4062]|nr:DUF2243 domain-containing protein [Ensifer sp. IC4062]
MPRAQGTRLIGCFALGVSIGGSFDVILLHQILQWHQLDSSRMRETTSLPGG